jgi:hypothetical protein
MPSVPRYFLIVEVPNVMTAKERSRRKDRLNGKERTRREKSTERVLNELAIVVFLPHCAGDRSSAGSPFKFVPI